MRAKYKPHGLSCLCGEERKEPYEKEARVAAKPFLSGLIFPSTGRLDMTLGSLSKLQRQRQRERHQTKGLMSRTIALHVRLKS